MSEEQIRALIPTWLASDGDVHNWTDGILETDDFAGMARALRDPNQWWHDTRGVATARADNPGHPVLKNLELFRWEPESDFLLYVWLTPDGASIAKYEFGTDGLLP